MRNNQNAVKKWKKKLTCAYFWLKEEIMKNNEDNKLAKKALQIDLPMNVFMYFFSKLF